VFLKKLVLVIKLVPKESRNCLTIFFKGFGSQSSQSITCFYCMRKDHSVRKCRIRKFDLPKGLVRWVPKSTSNTAGPKFNWVPIPQI